MLFLIPLIGQISIKLVLGDYSIQECLEIAKEKNKQISYSSLSDGYVSITNKEPSPIIIMPEDYDNPTVTSEVTSNREFVDVAKEIWQKVVNGNFKYRAIANNKTYYNQIPISNNYIDCSGFVSWVLYEYGYKNEFGGRQKKTTDFMKQNWTNLGWEEITIDAGEDITSIVKPGDIVVRANKNNNGYSFGHVDIIAKKTKKKVYAYDCGTEEFWKNSNGSPVEVNWFMKDERPGKIIRLNK